MDFRARMIGGFAVAATLCTLSVPAFAFDDGYQDVFSSVLTTVGVLKPETAPDIEYRERPPLVLPPRMELAKPVRTVARPASWPKDPDLIRARKASELARAPNEDGFAKAGSGLLSKDELARGRAEGSEPVNAPGACGGFHRNDAACRVTSDQLQAEYDHYESANPDAKKREITAGVEPDRLYLTQPPKGYLKPTKTIKATAEAPAPRIDESNPKSALVYRAKPDE